MNKAQLIEFIEELPDDVAAYVDTNNPFDCVDLRLHSSTNNITLLLDKKSRIKQPL